MKQLCAVLLLAFFFPTCGAHAEHNAARPGTRVLMDAHNCYPYYEWWGDRIERALAAGTPLAIEQDLYWYTNPKTGKSWSVVAHGAPLSGKEPTLETYFFDHVRPAVEKALREGNHGNWPIITLNLDIKTEQPEHLRAIWKELKRHEGWITTAVRTKDIHTVAPLHVRPILVLDGEQDPQQKVFFDDVKPGDQLLVFGAVHTDEKNPMAAPNVLEPERENDYRRWWNNPWDVVEAGGQTHAGAWTADDMKRLQALVNHAHENNLWIRFYTLDGVPKKALSCNGWFSGYDFGTPKAVRERWKAAYEAGVDYIATDEYGTLGSYLRQLRSRSSH